MSDKILIRVDTPVGTLEVYLATDPSHPGVCIDLEGEPVAIVEYDSEKGVRTLAWNNQEEDYQEETIFNEDFNGEPSAEDEQKEQNFFEGGNFLVCPGREEDEEPYKYLWDGDFRSDAYTELFDRCALEEGDPNKLYIYSLTEEDGGSYVTEGKRFVNRVGYFFSTVKVDNFEEFRYW